MITQASNNELSAVSVLSNRRVFHSGINLISNWEVIKTATLTGGNVSRGHSRCLRYEVHWLICCSKSTHF